MELGQGSYGAVIAKDGKAVKQFHKMSHLIQEYTAGKYLSNCSYTVKVLDLSLDNITMDMELYDATLRDMINRGLTKTDRDILLEDILKSLIELHDRGLVHGDVKPGNILIRRSPLGAVLGDLGFVSVGKYSKVKRTAAVYRELKPIATPEHDMFSFGIILLEIYGDVKVYQQLDEANARKVIRKEIQDDAIGRLIKQLLKDNTKKRPNAHQVLELMFNKTHMISVSIDYFSIIDGIIEKTLAESYYSVTKKYKIHRSKVGYHAITHYLINNKISQDQWYHHCLITIIILSAIFGRSGFDENEIRKISKVTIRKSYIRSIIHKLLNNDLFVNEIMRIDYSS